MGGSANFVDVIHTNSGFKPAALKFDATAHELSAVYQQGDRCDNFCNTLFFIGIPCFGNWYCSSNKPNKTLIVAFYLCGYTYRIKVPKIDSCSTRHRFIHCLPDLHNSQASSVET